MDHLPLLQAALEQLLNKQEKTWGYFQVKKEKDNFYRLHLPYYTSLWLYQNEKNSIYEAYWQNTMPVRDRTSTTKAAVFVRKKTKKVYFPKEGWEKKQRIFVIVCRSDSRNEVQLINTMLANSIQDKIQQIVINVSHEEIVPQTMIAEEV